VSFVVNRLWFSILQQKLWLNRYNSFRKSFRKSATQGCLETCIISLPFWESQLRNLQ
jgi:hypothetical protein